MSAFFSLPLTLLVEIEWACLVTTSVRSNLTIFVQKTVLVHAKSKETNKPNDDDDDEYHNLLYVCM